jgi:hypothetical protein
MLLILGYRHDETAAAFSVDAWAAGVECMRMCDPAEVEATVRAERDGSVKVELRAGSSHGDPPSNGTVTAVLNRGLPLSWGADGDEGFRNSEVFAAWWTALAFFPGPVVNRPTLGGFSPYVDVLSLARAVENVSSRGFIGPSGDTYSENGAVNIHRVRDGLHMGRLADHPVLDDELYLFTPFDRRRVARLLLAGRRVFDLGNPSGTVAPGLAGRVQPLVRELLRREALFCSLVVEEAPEEDALYLLQTSALPSVHQYRHIAAEVHRALLDYLSSGSSP